MPPSAQADVADLKRQSQFIGKQGVKPPGLIEITKTTLARNGISGMYAGVGALCAGNSLKAAVRFVSYDRLKVALRKEDGKLSPVRSLLGARASEVRAERRSGHWCGRI